MITETEDFDEVIEPGEALLACPFCGHEGPTLVETYTPSHGFRVDCKQPIGCHATTGYWTRTCDAISAWNERQNQLMRATVTGAST